MPMFVAITANAEVNGETVFSVVDGMGMFKTTALAILAKNGIQDPKPGLWYSQQAWLKAFQEISASIGPYTLYSIGLKIPENAHFPPQIDSIENALRAIDVAYHMNHRIAGQILFDPQTGTTLEGIGHYIFEKAGEREVKMTCHNPYPCDFDKGIIDGMANRFKPAGSPFALVRHADTGPCRKKGAEMCEYKVSW
jgi:hypothetical protein